MNNCSCDKYTIENDPECIAPNSANNFRNREFALNGENDCAQMNKQQCRKQCSGESLSNE